MHTCKKFLAIFIFIIAILFAYNVSAALPINGSCSSTRFLCSAGTSVNNATNGVVSTWNCNGLYGGTNASCSQTMSGTLSAVAPSCTISSGSSSCNTNLSWSTTNPQGTSAITANGMANVNGNSGSYVSFSVPYNSRTFYLYNNGNLLAQKTVTSSCAANNTWNGSKCALNSYTITTSSGSNGTVTPAGTTTKNYGTSQTYTIAPSNSNYRINNVLIDNEIGVGAVSSYTFSNITANHSISATFALKTYTVTATAGSGGTISPSSRTVNAGSATTFTVTPNTGYYISSVTGTQSCGNGSLSGNIYTAGTGINGISEDCTVTAKFGINTYTITTSSGSNGTVTPAGTTTKNYGTSQ